MRMRGRGLLLLVALGLILWLGVTGKAHAECQPTPVGPNTPTGIAGCEVWGKGIASHYAPGTGVAMNFCTWTYRHQHGCGKVKITSLTTNITVVAPVIDFCDCYTGTKNQRIVDLQYGVVAALGLKLSTGLYPVTVEPFTPTLPNTAMESSWSPVPSAAATATAAGVTLETATVATGEPMDFICKVPAGWRCDFTQITPIQPDNGWLALPQIVMFVGTLFVAGLMVILIGYLVSKIWG